MVELGSLDSSQKITLIYEKISQINFVYIRLFAWQIATRRHCMLDVTVPSDAIDQDEIFLVVTPFTFTRGGSARCPGIPRIHSAAVSQSSLHLCTNPRRDGFTGACLGPRWRALNAASGNNPAKRFPLDARLANACSKKIAKFCTA